MLDPTSVAPAQILVCGTGGHSGFSAAHSVAHMKLKPTTNRAYALKLVGNNTIGCRPLQTFQILCCSLSSCGFD